MRFRTPSGRRTRFAILCCTLLAGAVLIPVTTADVLSGSPAGASVQSPTAPGTYQWTVTNPSSSVSTTGTLTLGADETFASTLVSGATITDFNGIWATIKNDIALEVTEYCTGSPPSGCLALALGKQFWLFVGHLSKKGIKSGTVDIEITDSNGGPLGGLGPPNQSTLVWSAIKG